MTSRADADAPAERRRVIVTAAERAGLFSGGRDQIGARVPRQLLAAAKEKTGLASTTEVLEYALAKLAVEDDFGRMLLLRTGSVPQDLDLEL